jgi:hypothetical protein
MNWCKVGVLMVKPCKVLAKFTNEQFVLKNLKPTTVLLLYSLTKHVSWRGDTSYQAVLALVTGGLAISCNIKVTVELADSELPTFV